MCIRENLRFFKKKNHFKMMGVLLVVFYFKMSSQACSFFGISLLLQFLGLVKGILTQFFVQSEIDFHCGKYILWLYLFLNALSSEQG